MTELPLSFAQEQLWFIDEFHHGLAAHNRPSLIRLRGPLDPAALSRALAGVVARHEALRTRLLAGPDGQPVQVIDPPPDTIEIPLTDLSGRKPAMINERLRELASDAALVPFKLAADWPWRAQLVQLAASAPATPAPTQPPVANTDTEHALVLVAHRTAFDTESLRVLVAELAALYGAEVSGEPSGLDERPAQFAAYAVAERAALSGPEVDQLEKFWLDALGGFETSQFPADRPRPLLASHDGAVAVTVIDPGLTGRLAELAAGQGTNLPDLLLAALQALLYRYTGQTDVVIGTMAGHRDRAELPELAGLIGSLAGPLPVRADLSGDPAFTGLLGRVRDAAQAAREHQALPFARVVEVLALERDPGRFPVFQIALDWQEPPADTEAAGVSFRAEPAELRAAMYDLGLAVRPGPDGLRIEATYPPALFDAATVERLLGHWAVLLRGIAGDPAARLSELPVLTEAERHRELVGWNDTATELPVTCIHHGFEARAAAAPAAVAAEFEGTEWSYAELSRRASQVARRLRELGVGPEVLVGVCMQTGLDRLAALLGVWKAGGGYVPLDPAAPADRLSFMIADTAMPVLLTDDASAGNLPATSATVVSLDAEAGRMAALDGTDLTDTGVTPASVAYVIYTSGSTGQPKGVAVEHRQAINFLHGMVRAWHITPDSAVLSFAAVTFDVSVMDMFMPLLGGARIVLAAPPTLHSPPRLAELIRDRHVTFACLPPAVLALLTGEQFPELRTLLSAGEELTSELLRSWLRPGLEIYNGYGPTECSIGSTFMKLEPATQLPPPIGRPKPNYQAYVLDAHLNPVPVGVTGELHIGGAGVARGYLNRPELTREKFIPDPFRPGQRLYKTGDLVRRRADGTIGFVGRADNQVKIRGLRIELGEIEAALTAHPAVAQAVVIVHTDPAGEKQLAAYLRPEAGDAEAGPTTAELRAHLAHRLPAYMIPAHLIALDRLPLTTNGKIDKAALPPPEPVTAGAELVPPRTLLETFLVDLYVTVLGHEHVGAADSFFDAGGSSLAAMQLVTELRSALAVDLDVSAIFVTPAPQQLAGLLRDQHGLDDADLADESLDDLTPTA